MAIPKSHNVIINWDDQKEKLKKHFSGITNKDLYFEEEKMGEMLEKLQKK